MTLAKLKRPEPIQCASLSIGPCLGAIRATQPSPLAAGDSTGYFLLTPELRLLAETEVNGSNTKPVAYSYLWFGDLPVAMTQSSTNTTRWYGTDQLGTPLVMTDAAGTSVWRAEYTPYGGLFSSREGESLHQPLRFPGQVALDGNDTYYNVFRHYRSGWGRYTQPDPIDTDPFRDRRISHSPDTGDDSSASFSKRDELGLSHLNPDDVAASTEPYAYASDSPLRYRDPLGLYPCVVYSVNSRSDYMQDIYARPGKTFLGCQYIGTCGPPRIQYLVHYQRSAPLNCPCRSVCIFSIDLAKGIKNGQAKCLQ